ncbi:Biopolymer transport protein ExbD [Anaerolineae bacterium]|nr:Biopolymer transport protein ExbD [Anaerolineae bacterium]
MAFASFDARHAGTPVSEINMVPLIDVMLVLLVIFIIAAPMLTHAVKVDLPRASSAPEDSKPEVVSLAVDASGTVYWNDQKVDATAWRDRMAEAASRQLQPELRIRADGAVAYRIVAGVMSDAASAGLTRIGFVTQPR